MDNKPRSSNFELLRIIAMLMIVASHYAYYGIMHSGESDSMLWQGGTLSHRILACFLIQGELGVALFFMISGYFLFYKNNVSVFKVALKTVLYSYLLGFTLIVPYFKYGNGGGTIIW